MTRRRSSVRGGNKFRKALRRLPKEIRQEMGDVLEHEAKALRDAIAAAAPKDQGDLARAAKHKIANDKLSARIGYSPKFKRPWKKGGFVALWKEFGARHDPAEPFIRPTFKLREPAIKENMRRALNNMIRRAKNWGK